MYQRMKMLLGGLILSTGLVVATPVSYAAETQVNGEEDIELAYENIDNYYSTLSISGTAWYPIQPEQTPERNGSRTCPDWKTT